MNKRATSVWSFRRMSNHDVLSKSLRSAHSGASGVDTEAVNMWI